MKYFAVLAIVSVSLLGLGCTEQNTQKGDTLSAADISRIRADITGGKYQYMMDNARGMMGEGKIMGTYHDRQVEVNFLCFGDVCPQNGGVYLRYLGDISEAQCNAMEGEPIVGVGWGRVYAGCGVGK